ncbi:CRISPR-associated endonuclease Cas1 [Desulfurobacterium atlanticum]|uniref:CRISPR-associated endonuclease Cas1 n=1 Tax=Desulfurobacterium atlanticum TaxID=240169 RepID=A0A238XMY2_9BACT|nr:CRISPR-associated endonuclease Cas1 [Desulfurobacterium atlanticum]SNR60335.1 CRISPR-associated protein, Cas1 family [Desulfurobacterium atlanticum]
MKGFLFITTNGTKVSKDGNELIVETDGKKHRIPIGAISHVFLMGNVNITVSAIKFLSTRGRYLFILNKFGRLISVVYPEFIGSDNRYRGYQYLFFKNPELCINLTKKLLNQKLESVVKVLAGLYKESGMSFSPVLEWKDSVSASLKSAENTDSLLGVDGTISRFLFSKLASFNESPFYFEKREYYPPKDPVNALLSLTYTLFYSVLHPVVISAGLDPYYGFFHVKRGKHAALCSDLLELVRPELSLLVFNTLNDGFFDENDFLKESGKVYLKGDALKIYLKYFTDIVIHNKEDTYFSKIGEFIKTIKQELKRCSTL